MDLDLIGYWNDLVVTFDGVMREVWEWGAPQGQVEPFIHQVKMFTSQLPLDESWLVGLFFFHVVCMVTILLTRHWLNFQTGLFLFLAGMAYTTEYLNQWAAQNWKSFAQEQYFDKGGVFLIMIYTLPLIINLLLMTILWLCTAFTLLVQMKKCQIRAMVRQVAKDNKEGVAPAEKKTQ